MAGRGVVLLCRELAEFIWSSNKSGKSPTWLLTNCSISEETKKQNIHYNKSGFN